MNKKCNDCEYCIDNECSLIKSYIRVIVEKSSLNTEIEKVKEAAIKTMELFQRFSFDCIKIKKFLSMN